MDSFIDELSKEIEKKCSLVLEETDFHEDAGTIVIKLDIYWAGLRRKIFKCFSFLIEVVALAD